MIRHAVCAIIFQGDNFLLVHKVKNGIHSIPGHWDFPRGGIDKEEDLKVALIRELLEETGSDKYKIIKHFDDKLYFDFSSEWQKISGFKGQSNDVFLAEYIGDGSDLKPQDDEIDDIKFYSKEKTLKLIYKKNKEFFEKNM